ncbi:MAG: M20/M25/M40 family metallo-hydrolase [Actinomycetota bacterium]|nr:M20/M25/M40 family metallo-hydrolase [Actinomycetota bacterium]
MAHDDDVTGETVELLQTMIRNRCVNDGTPESGQEARNADVLESVLEGAGLDVERYTAAPGRDSLIARIEGTDREASPSLALMGHTDVVPADERSWTRDPFGGELVANAFGVTEVWGRGAVDMLNLTASMAVAFCRLARDPSFRPRGDLVFVAVADEESGSAHGLRWLADHARDSMYADFVLTENGGLHSGTAEAPLVTCNVAEKGVAWRRLRITGTPGHGSMPFRSDNALVKAAAIVTRIAEYRPAPRFHELWRTRVETLPLDDDTKQALLDPARIDDLLAAMPNTGSAAYLHACTHTTFSANVLTGTSKTNVIPGRVEIDVDVRTLPGEDDAAVRAHLREAIGADLADEIEIDTIIDDAATISSTSTPLWESLQRSVARPFPAARLLPSLAVGFTDARIYRELGAVAYGAGLLSPELDSGAFSQRFHGNDERIDVESLRLTTQLWLDVVTDFHRR